MPAYHRSLRGLIALILEDEYYLAQELKEILVSSGASIVRMSGDIDDALLQIAQIDFSLALLNLNIHGKMAYNVADELKRRDIPFAFVSGYEGTKIPQRFQEIPNWGKLYDDKLIVAEIQHLWARSITA